MMDEIAAHAIFAHHVFVKQSTLLCAQFIANCGIQIQFLVAMCETAPIGIDTVSVFDKVSAQLYLYLPGFWSGLWLAA
jgi:hypothetical protein